MVTNLPNRTVRGCAFCNFRDSGVVVYDDEYCFAVVSAQPINPFHMLVIPKEHYEDLVQLPPDLLAHLAQVTQRFSRALRIVSKPLAIVHLTDDDVARIGYNLVAHFKIHIIPRFEGDKVRIEWNRAPDPGPNARAVMAEQIRLKLGG